MSVTDRRRAVREALQDGPKTIHEVTRCTGLIYRRVLDDLKAIALRDPQRRWHLAPCDPRRLLDAYMLVMDQGWTTDHAAQTKRIPEDALLALIHDGEPFGM